MSSKFSLLASAMPTFTQKTTVEAKVDALADYQVQLLEYLRYSMSNLDADNFNPSGLNEILEPVVVEIKGMEDQFTSLTITVDGFKTTVEGYEKSVDGYAKQVSSFEQTVGGFRATVEGYGDDVEGYAAEVGGYARQVSSFNQTVNGFNTTVKSYEQKVAGYTQQVSSFEQTASSISAKVSSVANGSGNVTAASIVAAINATSGSSMVKIEADHIKMTGTTTFVSAADLGANGTTEIDGGRISTGYISADRIYGGTLTGVTIQSQGWYSYEDVTISDGVINIANGSARIGSNGMGAGYFAAATTMLVEGESEATLQCGWNYCVVTQNGAKLSYDHDTYRIWVDGNGCWSNKSMAVYSDRRMKSEINYDMGAYEAVFNGLRPCTFLYNGEKDGKRHMGFVAQEFVQAATDSGLTVDDFAMIASDGEYYGIAYGEMTALNTHMIQRLMERVNKLEERL